MNYETLRNWGEALLRERCEDTATVTGYEHAELTRSHHTDPSCDGSCHSPHPSEDDSFDSIRIYRDRITAVR